MKFSPRVERFLWSCIAGAALLSLALYFGQGGFRGGRGKLDLPIALLSMPWCFLPFPFPKGTPDFVLLSVLPAIGNSVLLVLLKRVLRSLD